MKQQKEVNLADELFEQMDTDLIEFSGYFEVSKM